MQKTIYLLSGIGADDRLFTRLELKGYKQTFIKWEIPLEKELMADYALRISKQITSEKPIIIGLSFGGMIATEIGKILDCERIIIVSSAKTKQEIPALYRSLGALNIHKLIPTWVIKKGLFLGKWLFGVRGKNEQELLQTMLNDTNHVFLKWAMNAVVNWENETVPPCLIHIHGDKDLILPIKNKEKVDFIVKNGKHVMIYNEYEKINKLLNSILEIPQNIYTS